MLVFEATSSAEKETSNLCSLDVQVFLLITAVLFFERYTSVDSSTISFARSSKGVAIELRFSEAGC